MISHFGYQLSKLDARDLAIDSSGFETRSGSIWRFIKWDRRKLSKTSKLFRKIHLAVSLPSRAVVAAVTTKSREHDAHGFGRLWLKLSKKLIPKIRRVNADKAYWSENILGFLHQEKIKPVIPCKSNSVNHGTKSPMDRLVKLQRKYSGIYCKNCCTYIRAEVEHVFGHIKIRRPILRDRKMGNKTKALLIPFLWYTHKLLLEGVSAC